MNTIRIVFLMLLITITGYAQEHQVDFNNNADHKIVLAISQGDVKITGYEGDQVRIKTDEFYEKPERAKGLRSLYSTAEDNTGLGLSVVKEGKILNIVKASRSHGNYEIEVPSKVAVAVEQVNWGGGDLEIENLEGELEIKSNDGDIVLKNIAGPLVASSTSGDVTANFNTVRQGKPSAISIISGDVDISLPSDTKADFKLQSISGEIYTDFDITMKGDKTNKEMQRIGGGYTINGSTNGGGTEMSIKTISGDVYLRKRK